MFSYGQEFRLQQVQLNMNFHLALQLLCSENDLVTVCKPKNGVKYSKQINILGPTSFTSRLAGFFLYVSNTTSKQDGHLCFHEIQTVNGTPSEDQRIHCSVHGRYVIYYNERRPNVTYPSYYSEFAYYELCELEVYGEVFFCFHHKYSLLLSK